MIAKKSPSNSVNLTRQQAKNLLVIVGGILLLSVILLLMAFRVEHREVNRLSAIPTKSIELGKPITMGAVEVTIDKVAYGTGQPPFIAPKGKRYAIVSFNIMNRTDAPIQVLPANDLYLKNSAGDVAYISPYSLEQPFRAGELSPGERQKGDLSFLVSDSGDYKLYVDAIWSGGVITFATK